jgi:hypothetical protein
MSMTYAMWEDAGCPDIAKPKHPAPSCSFCAMCGNMMIFEMQAVRAKDAFGPGFTDFDKLPKPNSPWVCVPCVWAMGGQPPNTFRMWTVAYHQDNPAPPGNEKAVYPHGPNTQCTSKADMSYPLTLLLQHQKTAWGLAIAESGQIHTLPFTVLNRGDTWGLLFNHDHPWQVRYEREDIISTPREFGTVLYHVASLLLAGFIREDVMLLNPHPSKLVKYGISLWREHAEPLEKYKKSPLLQMAMAFMKKETLDDVRRAADYARAGFGHGLHGQRHYRQDISDELVAASEGGPCSGDSEGNDMAADSVGDVSQARNPDPPKRFGQLDLFDVA